MESEIFWQAVIANDVRFDGAFVLGVKTTGIYCRPSCRARLLLRKNVDFYGSPAVAEALGDKNKVRAVARACATNRFAAVIPCHRVIGKSGKMGGYRWGIERKEKLLANEKAA